MITDLYKLEITLENCHTDVRRTIIVPHDVSLDALSVEKHPPSLFLCKGSHLCQKHHRRYKLLLRETIQP